MSEPGPLRGAALAERVKALALETGFDLAGFARADAPPELAFFAEWVARGHAGEMGYLTGQVEKRSDLRARSSPGRAACSAWALQYDTPHAYSTDAPAGRGWIARYAWGDDYHDVLRALLERLRERLQAEAGPVRVARLRRHRPDRRSAPAPRPPGLGALGQEHLPAPSRARLLVLPGRARHRPRAAGRRAAPRHVRQLHGLPRRLPHAARSPRPTCSTPRAASAT